MRKRLSDITNALPQPKPSSEDASSSAKDYIESLTKVIYIYIICMYVFVFVLFNVNLVHFGCLKQENLTLVRLIQDKK